MPHITWDDKGRRLVDGKLGPEYTSTMRYYCYTCGKSVTSELPSDSVIRAILICPECVERDRVMFLEDKDKDASNIG